MRTAAAVFQSLSSAAREGAEAARLIQAMGAHLGIDAVVIYRLIGDGSLQFVGSDGYPGDLVSAWRAIPPGLDVPLRRAVRGGRPVYLEDRAARDRAFPVVAQVITSFQASASFPVVGRAHTLGAIGLGWREPQEFTPKLQAQVEHLVGSVGAVILRSVAVSDPALLWVSTLLELLFDPWILVDAVRAADGSVVDFAVVLACAEVVDSAPVEHRRLFEIAPELAEGPVFASLARVATFGGTWEAVLAGRDLGALARTRTTVRVRMFAVGEQYVLHWRADGAAPSERSQAGTSAEWADRGQSVHAEGSPLAATVDGLRQQLDRMRAAARVRAVVEQARGVLVERERLSLDAALAWLTDQAGRSGRLVEEVASELVGVPLPRRPDESRGPVPSGDPRAAPGSVLLHPSLGESDGDQAAAVILELAKPLGVVAVALYATTADGSLRVEGSGGYPPEVVSAWQNVPLGLDVPLTRAVNEAEPVLLSDRAAHGREFPLTAEGCMGFEATATLPVIDAERVIGAIGLAWEGPQEFDQTLTERLSQVVITAGPLLLRDAQRAEPENQVFAAVLEMLFDPWLLLSPLHDASGVIRDFRVVLAGRQLPGAEHLAGVRLLEFWPILDGKPVFAELVDLAARGGVRDRVLGPDEVAEPVGDAITFARGARVGPWVVLAWRTVPS